MTYRDGMNRAAGRRAARETRGAGSPFPPPPDLSGLPPGAARMFEAVQQQPMVIVAGMVGVTALTSGERLALLESADVRDALIRVTKILADWDVATTTHWDIKPLQLELVSTTTAGWVAAVRDQVNAGNTFTPPQVLVQLIRELLECEGQSSRSMTGEELIRLLVSIATEQQLHPGFGSDMPSRAELAALDTKFKAMTPDELNAANRDLIHQLDASMLFNNPTKIECLKADAFDFWYSDWSDRASKTLGQTPAQAFAAATGINLDDFLRAGLAIAETVWSGQITIRLDEIPGNGELRSLVTETMALDLDGYRAQLVGDRRRGDVKLQRYTFTQFPFLDLGGGALLSLRAQWSVERFLGEPPQFDVIAAFNARGDRTSARSFGEAIKYQFEDIVGRVVTRIADRSSKVSAVVSETDLQAEWTEKKGQPPSVCDWVLRAGPVIIPIEATHHPVNGTLAQGLGDGNAYSEDADKILTDRKFKQLASVMDLVKRRGWSGHPQPDAIFLPIVVVPNSGSPSSMLSELDNASRAEPIFAQFQGRVARPAVVRLQDLQLLEGIGDHLPIDVVTFMYRWRQTPLPLQDFLEMQKMPRPLSKYILRTAARVDRHLRQDE